MMETNWIRTGVITAMMLVSWLIATSTPGGDEAEPQAFAAGAHDTPGSLRMESENPGGRLAEVDRPLNATLLEKTAEAPLLVGS